MGVEFKPFEPAIDGLLFCRWLRGLDEWTSAHFGLGSDDDRLRLSLAEANLERLASECRGLGSGPPVSPEVP